jgi:hypothetical protein
MLLWVCIIGARSALCSPCGGWSSPLARGLEQFLCGEPTK